MSIWSRIFGQQTDHFSVGVSMRSWWLVVIIFLFSSSEKYFTWGILYHEIIACDLNNASIACLICLPVACVCREMWWLSITKNVVITDVKRAWKEH